MIIYPKPVSLSTAVENLRHLASKRKGKLTLIDHQEYQHVVIGSKELRLIYSIINGVMTDGDYHLLAIQEVDRAAGTGYPPKVDSDEVQKVLRAFTQGPVMEVRSTLNRSVQVCWTEP